jgi:mono/diheme cytochrome c family protein
MSQPNEGQDRLDYQETADITEVHAAISREHAEPSAEVTPIPTWLSVVCAAALCWAGAYIGIFHGGFNGKVYNEYESSPSAFFPLPGGALAGGGGPAAELPPLAFGEKVYKDICQACHQANGLGLPGQFPALSGSEWVDGSEYNEKRVVALLLKGLKGPITVKGASFNNQMPSQETLGPKKIAAVLTYVKQAWGNKGGEIAEAQVAAAKKEFADHSDQWTVEDIKKIPLDAKLEGAAAPAAPGATQAKADAKPGDGTKPAEAKPADGKPAVPVAPTAAAPAPSSGTFDLAKSISNGKGIYMTTCTACHMPGGTGVPGAFPPFDGSEWVLGDPRRMVALVIKGYAGPITVKGQAFNNVLIAVDTQFPQLKDNTHLADVLNFIRNSWSNKAGVPITPEFVQKVRDEFKGRTEPWNAADIEKAFPSAK